MNEFVWIKNTKLDHLIKILSRDDASLEEKFKLSIYINDKRLLKKCIKEGVDVTIYNFELIIEAAIMKYDKLVKILYLILCITNSTLYSKI